MRLTVTHSSVGIHESMPEVLKQDTDQLQLRGHKSRQNPMLQKSNKTSLEPELESASHNRPKSSAIQQKLQNQRKNESKVPSILVVSGQTH